MLAIAVYIRIYARFGINIMLIEGERSLRELKLGYTSKDCNNELSNRVLDAVCGKVVIDS